MKLGKLHKKKLRFDISFQIWGKEERKSFKTLYENYTAAVDSLLNKIVFNLHISVPFDSVKRADSNMNKFKAYIQEEYDDEDQISFLSEFSLNDINIDKIIPALLIYIALFDSCYEYISQI